MDGVVVIVGGVGYSVNIVEAAQMVATNEGETLFGDVAYLPALIRINEEASHDRQEQTLVHELVHAMMFEAGIEEQDEELVNRLDKVLYRFLKDNTDFFERLERPPEDEFGSEMQHIIQYIEDGEKD